MSSSSRPMYNITTDGVRLPYANDSSMDPWDLEKFTNNLQVSIGQITEDEMEFDLIGVDSSLANAIRRVLISEVPTIAIENVYVWTNTSIIVDEILSQRLGLVNLKVDPRKLEERSTPEPTDLNTLVFSLNLKCTRNPNAKPNEKDPAELYQHSSVYSGDIKWEPKGMQGELFQDDPPRPVHDDILLAKLRPGQEIICELHCEKNIGKEHAKWSPVATASYRLLPSINILKPIPSEHCEKFASCFPPGVVTVHTDSKSGKKSVTVDNPRKDTVSREVLRHAEFKDIVQLGRIKDHFIFNIESTGAYSPSALIPASLEVLKIKIHALRKSLKELS